MAKRKVFDILRSMYDITTVKPTKTGDPIAHPGEAKASGKIIPLKMPSDVEKLWLWWLKEVHDNSDSLKNRMDRYADLDYMYYNNTVISMAVEMYADETVQADSQMQTLQIGAKKSKVATYIRDFFDRIGISQKVLRSSAFDICLYGDHFWINVSDGEKGITEIVPIDVFSLKDRIEFMAADAERKKVLRSRQWKNLMSRDERLRQLATAITEKTNDYGKYFKKYLFGFQIGEEIFLPPWNVTHFRRFSTKSEFYPFGRPLLINAIAPFRMLQASKNIVAMARAAKFPREHYTVQVDENMTESEQWIAVNEARQEYQNLGLAEGGQTGKEEWGAGSQIWTPEGLLNFELIENRMNIDDISDLEMLRDDLILATRVPKGYLIVDRASFGTSGQALLQQFKPFGRAVFSIQSSILEELVWLVKLQFAMTGDFDIDEDFELSMAFPVVEESSDRLRMKSDTIRLANDILTNLTATLGLGRGDALPPDVVKDVFGKLSFLEPEDVDEWVNLIKPKEEEGEGGFFEIREKIKSRLNDEIIRESYFHAMRKNRVDEGVFAKRHFMSSFSLNTDVQKNVILNLLKKKEQLNG